MLINKKKIKNWFEVSGLSDMGFNGFALPAWVLPCAGAFLAAGGLTILATSGFSADFVFLTTALSTLCVLIGYDVISRRRWERDTAQKIKTLINNHDRLVREVARNRSDVAILKEGLSGIAAGVEDQGRRMQPSGTVEARMIETIVQRLGMMGDRPRAEVQTTHDMHVLELEMLPPPLRPAPLTELDEELNPDLGTYKAGDIVNLIRHAVRNDGIDVYIQPVVNLPQRKVRFYETFARLRAGGGVSMPASRYLGHAQDEQLVPAIDNLLLLRCLQTLRTRVQDDKSGVPYILNVTTATLNDRSFMNDLVVFLSQNRRMASELVFELPQAELESMDGPMIQVLDGLSKLGCRFSMDRVRKRQINVAQLKNRHVRFVKMDAAWILREGRNRDGFSRVVRLKKQLDAAGIDLIVEKIENEQMLRELLDYSIDYGQGWLFAKPDIWTSFSEGRKAA